MAGYSGKPLHAKLGLKPGQRVAFIADHDFDAYKHILGPDAPEVILTADVIARNRRGSCLHRLPHPS